jgi:cytochrome b561
MRDAAAPPSPARHSLTTRLLHLLLAAAILAQLADSQFMRVPRPNRPPPTGVEAAAFSLHEYVGLASLAVVVLFWLWLAVRHAETDPGALFLWFSGRRLALLRDDIMEHLRCAARLRLPDPDRSPALAPMIQGLGLVVMLLMAATGTYGYLTWTPGTAMPPVTHSLFEVHSTLANLVWGYVIVHVGAAVLHELLGHRLLRRMAPWRDSPAAG